ncbi:hypothetical protein ACV38A_003982 [Escherichia coli]|uniref:hypothetical protein n=1 Tax=Escherichia coli TaxID=562 RepID=UPI0011E91A42|nr:hypothetical protein [Escherichia coli]EGJ8836524.1 hypothetical protein [Salmonella enterica]EGO4308607.1 hypothetical protein [Escherichia coli]EKC8925769.1 hypothetical protein [Escherichia coli]
MGMIRAWCMLLCGAFLIASANAVGGIVTLADTNGRGSHKIETRVQLQDTGVWDGRETTMVIQFKTACESIVTRVNGNLAAFVTNYVMRGRNDHAFTLLIPSDANVALGNLLVEGVASPGKCTGDRTAFIVTSRGLEAAVLMGYTSVDGESAGGQTAMLELTNGYSIAYHRNPKWGKGSNTETQSEIWYAENVLLQRGEKQKILEVRSSDSGVIVEASIDAEEGVSLLHNGAGVSFGTYIALQSGGSLDIENVQTAPGILHRTLNLVVSHV